MVAIPAQPGETTKVEGSPSSAEAMAKRLTSAANTTEGQQDFAEGGAKKDVGVKGGAWSGRGASAYLGAIAPFASETSTAYTGLTRGAKALTAYGDKLTELKKTHQELVERRSNLAQSIRNFETEVRSWEGKDIPPEKLADLQGRSTALSEQVNTYTSDNDKLRTDTEANEKILVSGLGKGGGVSATGKSLTAEGYNPHQAIRTALDKVARGAHPQDLAGLSAEDRARWWAGLTPVEQEAVLQEFPEYLGNGQGLPAGVRDVANRQNLDRDISQSQAIIDAPFRGSASPRYPKIGEQERDAAEKTLRAALKVHEGLDKGEEDAPGAKILLYGYDAHAFGGDGKAIVGVGDMDNATNVAWNVPGMTTDITKTAGNVESAATLYNEASLRGVDIASVAWIGYDAPSGADVLNVAGAGAAKEGGDLLAADIKGFVAARDQLGLGQGEGAADKLDLHVIGHSYGSVTTGWAGDNGRLADDIDSITLIGSPGAGGAETAAEFGIGAHNVYVGSASNDPVASLGGTKDIPGVLAGLGTDPASTSFGGERFRAEGGESGVVGPHNSYYQPKTESLSNLVKIATGEGASISHEDRRSGLEVFDIGADPASERYREGR